MLWAIGLVWADQELTWNVCYMLAGFGMGRPAPKQSRAQRTSMKTMQLANKKARGKGTRSMKNLQDDELEIYNRNLQQDMKEMDKMDHSSATSRTLVRGRAAKGELGGMEYSLEAAMDFSKCTISGSPQLATLKSHDVKSPHPSFICWYGGKVCQGAAVKDKRWSLRLPGGSKSTGDYVVDGKFVRENLGRKVLEDGSVSYIASSPNCHSRYLGSGAMANSSRWSKGIVKNAKLVFVRYHSKTMMLDSHTPC